MKGREGREKSVPVLSLSLPKVVFLVLAFIENLVLLEAGLSELDNDKYDDTFNKNSRVLCYICFFVGVILQVVYYR